MRKDERSEINPFTGKKHFDILDDDSFLEESYREYNNEISQFRLLDGTVEGQMLSRVAVRLIDAVEEYLAEIGRSDYTENYYDWEFHLVETDHVNAFCMPGGKIVMYSGMMSFADSEEEVAFVLGHEMAHALLDHSRTSISIDNAKNAVTTASYLGSIGLSLIGLGELASVTRIVTDVADIGSEFLMMKPFERNQELEADRLGMLIIHWAGYNIAGIPAFWARMNQSSANNFDFFSTHPSDDKRINAMNGMISEIQSQRDFHSMPAIAEFSPDSKSAGLDNVLTEKQDVKYCTQCGAEAELDAGFCINCGNRLSEIQKCRNCGNEVGQGDSFCTYCGNRL